MKVNSHTSMGSSRPHLPLVPPSYGYGYTEHTAPATGIPEIGATQMGVPENVVPPSATVMVRADGGLRTGFHPRRAVVVVAGRGQPATTTSRVSTSMTIDPDRHFKRAAPYSDPGVVSTPLRCNMPVARLLAPVAP